MDSDAAILEKATLQDRLKPGRKSKKNEDDGISLSKEEMKLRKLLQNRKAQRAFRQRKSSKITELAEKVSELKETIETWEKKYEALSLQFDISQKENEFLRSELKYGNNNSVSDSPRLPPLSITPEGTPATIEPKYKDPKLNNLLENFQPMQAVGLKKQTMAPQQEIVDDVAGQDSCVFANDPSNKGFVCVCKSLKVPTGDFNSAESLNVKTTKPITSVTTMKRKFNYGQTDGFAKSSVYFNNGSYEIDFNEIQFREERGCCQKKAKSNWSCEKNCTKLFDEDAKNNDQILSSKAMTPSRTDSTNDFNNPL